MIKISNGLSDGDKMRILIVDDDIKIGEALSIGLENQGYKVDWVSSAADVDLEIIKKYDLIVLDIMLPQKNGYELCEELRERTKVPILFLSAKNQEKDIVKGFKCGGDDYLIKPFSMKELYCRIEAILRRSYNTGLWNLEESVYLGKILIDKQRGVVIFDDEEIRLTRTEYNLLLYFEENKNRLIRRDEIYEYLWHGEEDLRGQDAINAHVKNLRKKLANTNINIKNVWGRGYKIEIQ